MIENVRLGNYRDIHILEFEELEAYIGRSTKDEYRKFEYTTVASISLCTRAAIDGGLPPDEAYDIGEAMLQRTERAEAIKELHDIMELTAVIFAHEVRKCKQKKNNYVLEQCKNYIGRNIFKRIYIQEIAEYVGMNASYLSRFFSSTAIHINNRINRRENGWEMINTAEIFQNGMILQRNKPIAVWGTGTPGRCVTARIQGKEGTTVVDEDGQWQMEIPSLEASDEESLVLECGSETITYEEVAVGEVWVAGGQSNMEFWMRYEKHKAEAVKDCPNDRLRFFDVPKVCYEGQREEFDYSRQGIWRKASLAEELEYFSAVAYYFQKELTRELDVPVGIVGCTWGGVMSRAWMNPDTVRRVGEPWMRDYEDIVNSMDMDEYWQRQHGNPSNDRGNPFADAFTEFCLPRTPSVEELYEAFGDLMGTLDDYLVSLQPQSIPGVLYEWMLKPIARYGIRGFLWYQGEADDVPGKGVFYKDMLTGLISDWRALWGDDGLPFLFVQLPGYRQWLVDTAENHFPVIRKCQEQVADTVKNAWMCSISDAGEELDIHPKDKKVVGKRLALLALGHIYGRNILCDAPQAVEAKREKNLVTVTFTHAEGGLEVKGESVEALQVCSGGEYLEYTADVEDDRMVIRIEKCVEGAVWIQFAQTPWYLVNLYNRAGIPAVPFAFKC